MKIETAELLQEHLANSKFEIEAKETTLEFKHDFTDAEILALVEAEYGTSITQSVPDLFRVIIKELLKMAVDHGKELIIKEENEKASK